PARFRQVAAIGKVRVFENPSALGPAFVVPRRGAVVETDDRRTLARLLDPAFDPRVNVLVASRLPELPVRPTHPAGSGPPHVGVETPTAGRVRVDVVVDEPSVVVLSESHYPGWRVAVDGHPRPLLRVDYAFLGVAVEPGAHLVEFTFAPVSVRVGATVSSAGVLILLGLVVTAARRRRHGAPE
ncbi:MAG: YfhO family protein, partial [Acidobacteriota bacterium]